MAEPAIPLSVWPVSQLPSRLQRRGRYLPASTAHPARMLPALARRAIAAYTSPGELVLDPMCGIGTTLVEAAHLDRQGIGVEYEPRWAGLARANVAHATGQGAPGAAAAVTGDARRLARILHGRDLEGRAALLLTSPPYGPSLHGQVDRQPGRGVVKSDNRYSTDPANLAHLPWGRLLDGFADILTAATPFLRPGGIVVVTARPWRRAGALVDFPAAVAAVAEQAGLIPFERNVALLTGLRGDRLVPRCSFFQLDNVRRARRAGVPLHVIAHEDVLVLRKPGAAR